MKKTLIALAAVAATGAAFAQSSVTLSGSLDVGIVRNGAAGTTTLNQAGNGLNNLVFSGTEDLGGGLKANFVLQQRFNPTNGNNDGTNAGRRTFQGASTVGLSGGFGNIRFGREIEAYNDVNNWADPWGTVRSASVAAGAGNVSTGPDLADLGRSEGIHYNSPSFGGLTVGVTYGFKDQTAAQLGGAAAGTKALFSANAVYAAGPLTVMGGLMQNRYDDDAYVIGAGYNFGVADLKVAYHNVEGGSAANTANKYTALQFGVNVPMGATVFSAGYIRSETQALAAGPKVKSNKLGLGAQYNLSKRTAVIGTYGKAKSTKANFDLSIRHTF
ncbi:porin [Hydrogenophaga defluvii]|uniref:Porin n=1 Tax=Hydrogenophaga defluvii TaxID=249410 RepID=A0ABW2SAS2_9BURK